MNIKISMEIEETIFEDYLPVNTIAMANRLIEILKNGDTNAFKFLNKDDKLKYRKCLWLINQQVYGQMDKIDMHKEFELLTT